MSWEQRGNERYYYRVRRQNGRLTKEYLGSGPEAEAAARRAAELREFKEWYRKEVEELDRLDNMVNMIVEAYMLNAGYHKPNRGPWRKKRIKKGEAMTTPAEPPPAAPDGADSPVDAEAWERACDGLIKAAQVGDHAAIAPLRKLMSLQPATVLICGGDVAWEAVRLRTRNYAGTDLARHEAVHQRLGEMYRELGGDNPQPKGVERLLIERIISTWLHLYTLEVNAARNDRVSAEPNLSYESALSAAQKRFLSAMQALTELRKDALPAVQINVAHEQVNVAGSVG